jgi:GT2 family glycosyltransferase
VTGPLDPAGDVSVVVVAYREHEVLSNCLQSFEEHRPSRVLEVIVVDNSADGSGATVAGRFPWVDHVANERNVHFRPGNNLGARRARGRYLMLLNPDTLLVDSGSIAALARALDDDQTVGFSGPLIRGPAGELAPQGESIPGIGELVAMKTRLNTIWPGNPFSKDRIRATLPPASSGPVPTVSAAALLCRREEFLAVGGFDERARIYYEEPELARKLHARGKHGYYCADATIIHLWRQGGSLHADLPGQIAEFDEGLETYYLITYGWRGRLLLGLLDAPSVVGRTLTRLRSSRR